MRKFFSVVLFALFAFSLVTMTGCSSEITTTVIDQVTNDDYAYTVTQKSQKSFFYEEEYTVEFWGGTRAQRADITNAPFYRKYVTRWPVSVDAEIRNSIMTWQEMQRKQ